MQGMVACPWMELPAGFEGDFARGKRARWLLAALAVALVVIHFGQALQRAEIPFQIDYAEGTVLAGSCGLSRTAAVSGPGSGAMALPYGPVGYWLAAGVVKATGLSLVGPRCLVLGFAVMAAAILAGLTRALGGSRPSAQYSRQGSSAIRSSGYWLPLLRVDLLSAALSLAGLYVFVRWRSLVLAAVLFVAALFTKQTAVAAPLACVVALALERQWRSLGILAALASALAVLLAWSLGPYAYFHLYSRTVTRSISSVIWTTCGSSSAVHWCCCWLSRTGS